MHYQLSTLPNGLRVITESMPGVRSVAVGCWVDTGTRDERANEHGSAHFLEHLLFKGSEEIPAREISETFDAIGAVSNAFTSKEYTCYWARLLDSELDTGMSLLGEMLQRPAFRMNEIESEKHVIIEEINMNDDDPGDTAHEQFAERLFAGHELARPILGTRESIQAMGRADIVGFWDRTYSADSTVVSLAGSLDHDAAVDLVAKHFGEWSGGSVQHEEAAPEFAAGVSVVHRETEQAHIVIGGEAIPRGDDRRYGIELFNHVLGGGMSSRLFQKIREDRGLAYAVYSFRSSFAETGLWGVYVGTTPSMAETALELIAAEIEATIEDLSGAELDRAKGAVRGALALSLEDANSRMTRLGREEIAGLEHLSIDDWLRHLDAVTLDEAKEIAAGVFSGPRVIGAVGPFEAADLERFVA